MSFKYPGDTDWTTSLRALPVPHNPSAKERFANTQSKLPLLETISSCPVSFYPGEETPRLARTLGSRLRISSGAVTEHFQPWAPRALREPPGEVARQSHRLLFTLPANWNHLMDHCLSRHRDINSCRTYQLRKEKSIFSVVYHQSGNDLYIPLAWLSLCLSK